MNNLSIKKNLLAGSAAALLLGVSFPVLAGSSGHGSHGGHSGHHDTHGEAGHHDNAMVDTVKATVVSVDAAKGRVTLDHEALPNIGMDAMTMGFQLNEGVDVSGLKAGDKVQATIEMKQGTGFVITEVSELK